MNAPGPRTGKRRLSRARGPPPPAQLGGFELPVDLAVDLELDGDVDGKACDVRPWLPLSTAPIIRASRWDFPNGCPRAIIRAPRRIEPAAGFCVRATVARTPPTGVPPWNGNPCDGNHAPGPVALEGAAQGIDGEACNDGAGAGHQTVGGPTFCEAASTATATTTATPSKTRGAAREVLAFSEE